MEKSIVRFELLKIAFPALAHKGPTEVINTVKALETFVFEGVSDKPGTGPDDAGVTGRELPTQAGQKVPKNKT
jgi:hypothetical protein